MQVIIIVISKTPVEVCYAGVMTLVLCNSREAARTRMHNNIGCSIGVHPALLKA